ncbi:hypothetical protein KR018_007075 [Drosophila ironensis]|nr:hypothetical protein KR018_007075 [Drosophila ironensis]
MAETDKFNKLHFFENYLSKHKDLSKRQKEYKKILSSKLMTRKELIAESSFRQTIGQLQEEKNDLRAQIWVAQGVTFYRSNKRQFKQIACHVECQENLAVDINALKVSIANMDQETRRVSKIIYQLKQLTTPDERYPDYVMAAKKRLSILEDVLETKLRQECAFTAENSKLRQQLVSILSYRTGFNDSYRKIVQTLNSDKKYMCDLIEYSINTFDSCIDAYEKIDAVRKRDRRENEFRRLEAQELMRKLATTTVNAEFIGCKGRGRNLADLPPKEYARRDKFRKMHTKKINLYQSVLKKILEFSKSESINEVTEKFAHRESVYYSFFNYATEMSYHITLLNNAVNRLMRKIQDLHKTNSESLQDQLEKLEALEAKVQEKQLSNEELQKLRESNESRMEHLLQGVEAICESCALDTAPLSGFIGNHNHVSLVNVHRFSKALEARVLGIVASVYRTERSGPYSMDMVVRNVDKVCESITPLDWIVITQQCPECAETDAQNVDESGDLSYPHTIMQAKVKLYDKITQPEIQYRLHSISQCRLPHSRMLNAMRNV